MFETVLSEILGPLEPQVMAELEQAFDEARSEHSSLAVPPEIFARFVLTRGRDVDAISRLRLADLFLACACQRGDSDALATLAARCRPVFAKTAERYLNGDVAELTQRVFELVFVGQAQRPPKIGAYAGRGALVSWLSVVAVRLALRARPRDVSYDSGISRATERMGHDPELVYLKQAYREAFREAFRGALNRLRPEERNLLRFHFADGLNGRQIARLLRVHPATVSRRLDAVLERVRQGTLGGLAETMRLDAQEAESVMRLVQSHLEASVARYLGAPEG